MAADKHALALLVRVLTLLLTLTGGLAIGWMATEYDQLAAGVVSAAFLGLGLVLAIQLVPELPLAILIAGMPLWSQLPTGLVERLAGYWIPLTLVLSIGFVALYGLQRGKLRPVLPKPVWEDVWLVLFALWLGSAILWSSAPSYGAFKFLGFVANSVIPFFLVRVACHLGIFEVRRLTILLVLVGLFHVAVVLTLNLQSGVWSVTSGTANAIRTQQLTHLGLNKISESSSLATGLLAALWLLILPPSRGRQLKLLLAAAIVLHLWALLCFQQRGPQIAILLAVVLLLALTNRKIWATLRSGRLLTVAVLLSLAFVVLGAVLYALNPSFDFSQIGTDRNVIARLQFYERGWQAFLSQPLTGVGTGGMGQQTDAVHTRWYVHNLPLEILSETGIVGLVLFLAFSLQLAAHFRTILKRVDFLAFAPLAFAASMLVYQYVLVLFSTDLALFQVGVWAGILIGTHKMHQRNLAAQVSGSRQAEQPLTAQKPS